MNAMMNAMMLMGNVPTDHLQVVGCLVRNDLSVRSDV
jgi:hypothetical protein